MKKTLEGRMTALEMQRGKYVHIEIKDHLSGLTFLSIDMPAEKWLQMTMGRLAHQECAMEIYDLHNVGKKQEIEQIEIHLPGHANTWRLDDLKNDAVRLATELEVDGIRVDKSFSSKNSFFSREGEMYARTYARRWVDAEEDYEL